MIHEGRNDLHLVCRDRADSVRNANPNRDFPLHLE